MPETTPDASKPTDTVLGQDGGLPAPTAAEQALSLQLTDIIRDEIENAGGLIDFERFMTLALYTPALGYYSGTRQKFGSAGDFVTAPELSPLFARCLARQCQQILAAMPAAAILEAGAGSGAMAAELLTTLEAAQQLPDRYLILELSGDLRERQQSLLKQCLPDFFDRITWIESPPSSDFRGIVLANELLDAMPVKRFIQDDKGLMQVHVGWQQDHFICCQRPAEACVRRRIDPLGLTVGYSSEININAEGWIRSIADGMAQGVILIVDYGFPRAEYYHPDRRQGTLMCHYRHRAHGDPLILVGLQDITAHIDFTAVAEAGAETGMSVLGYTSQASFLLANGLDQVLAAAGPVDQRSYLQLAQQAKLLTLPSEMGELFKVMALAKGLDLPLQGFSLRDRCREL